MSGHSKWATIKRKKGANDARRSNEFAKLLRSVEVAPRPGCPLCGPDRSIFGIDETRYTGASCAA